MKLVDVGQPLLHPSICIICAHSPAEHTQTVDTLNELEVPGMMAGRKYVCQGCAFDIAKCYDFVSRASLDQLQIEFDYVNGTRAEALLSLSDEIAHLAERLPMHRNLDVLVESKAHGIIIPDIEVPSANEDTTVGSGDTAKKSKRV